MIWRPAVVLGVLAVAAGCGPRSVVVTSVPASSAGGASAASATPSRRSGGWQIATREHVDLWLHGFALLQADSSLVPYFRLDYRAQVLEARRAAGVTSGLDEQWLVLSRRVATTPSLTAAQFLALYFESWSDLRRGARQFLQAQGRIGAAGDAETRRMFATFATYFPTAADREWLERFVAALEDERTRFHSGWWGREQGQRAAARREVETLWQSRYAAAFQRFLRFSGQASGTLLLTLPLGGEGRSLDPGGRDRFIALPFPATSADAMDALHVLAHEVVGGVATQVVREQTASADEAARVATLAAVRGGAILLERIAPELVDGYRRYYLRVARQTAGSDAAVRFERVFPLAPALHDALVRQVELVLDGL